MASVSVCVRTVYRQIAVESSVMMVTQLKMAPEMMPFAIMGTVTRKKVLAFEAPSEIAASSTVMGICCRVATELRIVYGRRRITKAITMIIMVPVRMSGFWLKAIISAMPTTLPGMM